MARLARAEVSAADEIAIVHVMNRTVRRCFLPGDDPLTGQNYDHRKQWLDEQLIHRARHFGIDLLCQAILSNHFHLSLLDWTARQLHPGKRGSTPGHIAPLMERLGVTAEVWCGLVQNFGRLFSVVAGQPEKIDRHRSKSGGHRYRARRAARELLASA